MRTTKRKPQSVGEILRIEFLEPMGIKNSELADRLGVHRNTISNLLNNKTALTPELAAKLSAAFNNTAEFWLNIQNANDIWQTKHNYEALTKEIVPFSKPQN